MEPAHFVASSKGINLLKDNNNYLYFHRKKQGIQYTGHLHRGLQKSGLATSNLQIFNVCLPAGNPRSRGAISPTLKATGDRNTETDAKRVGVLLKESNEQVLIATSL